MFSWHAVQKTVIYSGLVVGLPTSTIFDKTTLEYTLLVYVLFWSILIIRVTKPFPDM